MTDAIDLSETPQVELSESEPTREEWHTAYRLFDAHLDQTLDSSLIAHSIAAHRQSGVDAAIRALKAKV